MRLSERINRLFNLNKRIDYIYNTRLKDTGLKYTGHVSLNLRKNEDIIFQTDEFPVHNKTRGCMLYSNIVPRGYGDKKDIHFRYERRSSEDNKYHLVLAWVTNGKGPNSCYVYFATNNQNFSKLYEK